MLKGNFVRDDKIDEIECNVQEKKGKTIKKNKKSYNRFSDHIGEFPLIIISEKLSNSLICKLYDSASLICSHSNNTWI